LLVIGAESVGNTSYQPGDTVRFALSLLICLVTGSSLALGQNVSEVQVTPETVTLKVGQKQALFAAAFDAGGNLIPTARFAYSSNNPTVAQVQADGVVIGLKGGAAIVQVSVGQKSFSVAISVETAAAPQTTTEAATTRTPPAPTGPPPSVLTIEPTPIYLLPSENQRLIVKAFRDDGTPAELPRVTWKSLTPETATIDAEGVIVGLAAGTAIVQASIPGGLAATAPVEVVATPISLSAERLILAPYDLDTIAATVPAQSNREVRGGLQWRSLNAEVVRVGPTGIVQAMKPGETEIVVTGFFQERRIPVRVHPPVQTLVVTPKPSAGVIRMPLQGTRSLTVRAEAADSTPVPEATLWWEVGDTAVVGYDAAKSEITARGLGTTTITLRARGFDPVSWVIEVIPGGIALDRTRFPMSLGDRSPVKASLVDEAGTALAPAQELEWSSDHPTVAVIGNDGMVEAVGFGHARLTATTRWGRTAVADVYVAGDLVFSANRGGTTFGIYQLALRDPSQIVPLLVDSYQNVQPALSPDRTTIAFSSNRSGDFELYLMDADGQNLRRLTTQPGADGDPAWTPDGKRIIYGSTRAGASQIFSIDRDGQDARQLTTSGGGNASSVVAPDGRSIAFISGRDGNDELYRMDLDGSNQVNLSNTREKEAAPQFFANGDLAFAMELERNGWQAVRMAAGDTTKVVLASNPNPMTSLRLTRDGERLAVVAGKIADRGRGRAAFTFSLYPVAGGAPFLVPVAANEQIVF
jgi:uncharacterized protein YjdB